MTIFLTNNLTLPRCPHCGIANPLLTKIWNPGFLHKANHTKGRNWAVYSCSSCVNLVMVRTTHAQQQNTIIENIYPPLSGIPQNLPEKAANYLKQAIETLHAPDGAAMLAGSAVDAMLKDKNLKEGSVYSRIETAVETGIITSAMGEWAHEVRLGSNRPRHSDEENPHVSQSEAEQSVAFVKALGQFLYELPAKIEEGKKAAQPAKNANQAQSA